MVFSVFTFYIWDQRTHSAAKFSFKLLSKYRKCVHSIPVKTEEFVKQGLFPRSSTNLLQSGAEHFEIIKEIIRGGRRSQCPSICWTYGRLILVRSTANRDTFIILGLQFKAKWIDPFGIMPTLQHVNRRSMRELVDYLHIRHNYLTKKTLRRLYFLIESFWRSFRITIKLPSHWLIRWPFCNDANVQVRFRLVSFLWLRLVFSLSKKWTLAFFHDSSISAISVVLRGF